MTFNNPLQNKATCKIYFLPSLFTAGNLFFGFLAIIRCIQAKYGVGEEVTSISYYHQAVWFIFLAFLCDALDGRIARLVGKESLFGKEFDSLADIVSFGVAPSLMMFFLILSPSEGYPIFSQIGWLIGFVYLLCCAVRLARFNVITHPLLPAAEKQSNMNDFVGLPVPAAASVVASLILIISKIDYKFIWFLMPGLMLLIAWLMVSTIRYPSFKNIDLRTQIKFRAFLLLVIVVATLVIFKEITFALLFLSYIFYGLFRHWCRKFNIRLNFFGNNR